MANEFVDCPPPAAPCERCRWFERNKTDEHGKRLCDHCRQAIPAYQMMQRAGFQSHTVDHYHETQIVVGTRRTENGNLEPIYKPIRLPIMLELCHECYLKDFAKNYPDKPLPDIANVRAA